MTYLLDSTVLIGWMRSGRNPVRIVTPWLRAGALAGCGIVRAEVLRGMLATPAREEMMRLFTLIPETPMGPDAWSDVADLAWQLDRGGRVLPLTDVAIAVCARRAHATLVTLDRHLGSVPGIALATDLPG